MKKVFFILFSFVLLTSEVPITTDQSEEASAHLKASYIYNFTKLIQWPEDYKKGSFVIGIVGSNEYLSNELFKMASSKTVDGQKFEIKILSSTADLPKIHIIYLSSDNSTQLSDVVNQLKGKSTLIITEKTGLAKQGSGINFVYLKNKMEMELNKPNIEKCNLKMASKILEMSIQVK
jgi:hypothetical protein